MAVLWVSWLSSGCHGCPLGVMAVLCVSWLSSGCHGCPLGVMAVLWVSWLSSGCHDCPPLPSAIREEEKELAEMHGATKFT